VSATAKICKRLALVFGVLALTSGHAAAQTRQRVEITGSSIRRIEAETALPVLVLKRQDIERSGATSVVDLLHQLPVAQGATGESAAVGGQTYGFSGVSVHRIGETRTLVLLNGHRLALFGGQTLTGFAAAFDLNALPVSAIERIEVLTDGASALYGADAIAGVVNFITKRDFAGGDVTAGYSAPRGGARETRVSASKGFGRLDVDGYNVTLSFGHDERTQLASTDRDFARTGLVFFSDGGKNYRFQQFSASSIPANVTDDAGRLVSPYLRTHGACPPQTFRVTQRSDDFCGFDFVSELGIYPQRSRDAFFGSANVKLGEQRLFADVLASQSRQTSRIAPVPGSIPVPAGSALFDQYLAPLGITRDSVAFYRLSDMGKRVSDDKAGFFDLALGANGTFAQWDYEAVWSHSESDVKGSISGYPGALALNRLRASGLLDPFILAGQQSPAAQQAIQAANYRGYWDGGLSRLDTLAVHGSRQIAALPAGPLLAGAGVNINREHFQSKPSLFAQGLLADPVAGTLCDPTGANPALACDTRFGDAAKTVPYSAQRTSWGVFGEVSAAAMKGLELNLQARHDHYSDFGNAQTGKASLRWQPAAEWLVRGSLGTGFHAPSVPQVDAAQQPFGFTTGRYACTPELAQVAAGLGAVCRPGAQQYDRLAAGNKQLQPEKSRQATLGLRFDAPAMSAGVDLWHVEIRDRFGQLTEQAVFADPLAFASSWGTSLDIATGKNYLAFLSDNRNLGKSFATGLDFDVTGRAKTRWGDLSSQVNATYVVREVAQLRKNGPYFSAVGNYADLGAVTFRWQARWATTLKAGAWTHTLGINFKSGYTDQQTPVDVLGADGTVVGTENIRLHVPPYATADWRTAWSPRKDLVLTAGALNVLDRRPPFSLATSGVNKGQQFGYDNRYYDPRGRTWYVNASYRF
jgi:iron complex outermembrane receptor protein